MRFDRILLAKAPISWSLSRLLSWYVLSVRDSARLTVEPPDAFDAARAAAPAIFTLWHGLAVMSANVVPADLPFVPMIARNSAAGIAATAANMQGLRTIRASGAHQVHHTKNKGGATGFRQALRELAAGNSVLMTADVPKVAQVAGRGVIELARRSGRPIIPTAYVSRWGLRFNNWDRMVVDLPFSRATLRHGAPIFVAADSDDQAVEMARRNLTEVLDQITQDAYQRSGIADKFQPGPAADG